MDELLAHPAIQGGVAPFLVAFFFFMAFGKFRPLAGLGVVAAFLVTVALIVGFNFDPLTSTRKIILLAMVAACLGLLLDFIRLPEKYRLGVLFLLGMGALIWVAWPVLAREEVWAERVLRAAILGGFAGWYVAILDYSRKRDSIGVAAVVAAGGIGFGGAAVIGASALLGQLGMAVGAAGMAALLANVIRHQIAGSTTSTLTAGVTIGLLAPASVLYAKVPLSSLLLLALVPAVALLPFDRLRHVWIRAAAWLLVAMVPAAVAMWLAFESAGAVPF